MDEAVSTTRLEAFSDGVFAIAITLLILDVHAGAGPLGHGLVHAWPAYLAYATSFLTIGVIWINHHLIFSLVERSNRTLQLLNLLFLMVIAFIPFPTRLVAEHLRDDGERAAAVALGMTFVGVAAAFLALWLYVSRGRRLIREDVPQIMLDDVTRSYLPGVPVYAATLGLAFASPLASVGVLLVLAVFYALPPHWLRLGSSVEE